MSLAAFEKEISFTDRVGENDRLWFPRWLRRYALSLRKGLVADLPVNEHSVIGCSKGLMKNGAPAWQRWQAVHQAHALLAHFGSLAPVVSPLCSLRTQRPLAISGAFRGYVGASRQVPTQPIHTGIRGL